MAWQAGQAVNQAEAEAIASGVVAVAGDRNRGLQKRAPRRLSLGGGQPVRPGTMVWPASATKPIIRLAALQSGLDPGQPAASILSALGDYRSPGIRRQPAEAAPVGAAGDHSPYANAYRRALL